MYVYSMDINLHLSHYWLLVPVVLLLALWVRSAAAKETGGYFSGLGTFMVFVGAVVIFLVAVVVLMAIHLLAR